MMVKRVGARRDDRVAVTGTIGDAALGLQLRLDDNAAVRWAIDKLASDYLAQRYLVPEPRNALAEILRSFATAAMDISDGLAGDLEKLCRASDVSADIDVARVPLSPAARAALGAEPSIVESILTNGDDYEILAAIPADRFDAFSAAARAAGVAVTDIGVITARPSAPRFVQDGRPLKFARRSFSHF
jgi:thiamine-monophosphate kinase